MSKYLGPKLKIIKKLGFLPNFTSKIIKRKKTLINYSKKFKIFNNLCTDYKDNLIKKQKIKYTYGITEKQLFNYYKKIKFQKGSKNLLLLKKLEMRLDCILYRLGFAVTIFNSKQIINHKHILINNHIVNIPSFLCKKNDLITINSTTKTKLLILNNFKKSFNKRQLILNRLKKLKLFKYKFLPFLPPHLLLNKTLFCGKVTLLFNKNKILGNTNLTKIFQYYT
jgi:small subunit ribosomal protein S4